MGREHEVRKTARNSARDSSQKKSTRTLKYDEYYSTNSRTGNVATEK